MQERHSLELKPIGIIHSPYHTREEAPHQGYERQEISRVELFKEFEEGLKDIEKFSHIILIYWFHKSEGYSLTVRTPWDTSPRGLFATRSPNRPCPLGLCVAELLARERKILTVRGLDALDGTPLLDIKPYSPAIDARPGATAGWREEKLKMEES
jgi:tRNA-Thr(GGU) m(6)t(6)A37 methyltransferase TsaA